MAYKFYSVGDFLTAPHIAAFDGKSKITVSYWARYTDRDGGNHVSQLDATKGWGMGHGSGPAKGVFYIRDTYDHQSSTYQNPEVDFYAWNDLPTWYHYFFTVDIATYLNGQGKFYRNGTAIGAQLGDQWNTVMGASTALFQIGGVTNSGFEDVELAEVAVWADGEFPAYASLLAANQSPMAMVVTPTFYARLKTDASTLTGQTLTVNGGAAQVADTLAVDAPPGGGGGGGALRRIIMTTCS